MAVRYGKRSSPGDTGPSRPRPIPSNLPPLSPKTSVRGVSQTAAGTRTNIGTLKILHIHITVSCARFLIRGHQHRGRPVVVGQRADGRAVSLGGRDVLFAEYYGFAR